MIVEDPVFEQVQEVVLGGAAVLGLPLVLVTLDASGSVLVTRWRVADDGAIVGPEVIGETRTGATNYPYTVVAIGASGETRTTILQRPGEVAETPN
jgi:hypothetical protein